MPLTSLYLDASILVKLLREEPETPRIIELLAAESDVVVSTLARLEALVVVDSWRAGGLVKREAAQRRALLEKVLAFPPFRFAPCRAGIFEIAEAQLSSAYCPTLDRLHLSAMQDLRLHRIFTNDSQQAAAARALRFEVMMPR